jgi:hypothetical protein
MKEYSECVALLGDVVRSRSSDRSRVHEALLTAIDICNKVHAPLDPLRVTVGDEVQGVYATLGEAVSVLLRLRDELLGVAEVRCGLGGGQVQVIDARRGIQDGPAWWRAREAIERAETLSRQPGNRTSRTAVIDGRAVANPLVDPTLRMIDAKLAALSPGARRSWVHLRAGLDNAAAAKREGVTPSANSQRVNDHGLRPLAALVEALSALP